MQIQVENVQINEDNTLLLEFSTGERKTFDVTPYLEKGIFKKLQDRKMFASAHVENGTVVWSG